MYGYKMWCGKGYICIILFIVYLVIESGYFWLLVYMCIIFFNRRFYILFNGYGSMVVWICVGCLCKWCCFCGILEWKFYVSLFIL